MGIYGYPGSDLLAGTDFMQSTPISVESVSLSFDWERLNFPQVAEEH